MKNNNIDLDTLVSELLGVQSTLDMIGGSFAYHDKNRCSDGVIGDTLFSIGEHVGRIAKDLEQLQAGLERAEVSELLDTFKE